MSQITTKQRTKTPTKHTLITLPDKPKLCRGRYFLPSSISSQNEDVHVHNHHHQAATMSGLQGVYSLITIYFLLLAFPSTSSFFTGQYLRHHPIYHLPTAFEFFTTRSSKHKHDTKLLVSDSGDVNVGDNHDEMSLKNPSGIPTLPLLFADSKCVPSQMSPTSLAYIGDVVYEMCIRCRYVWPTRRTTDLQNVVVAKVRGTFLLSSSSSVFCLTFCEQV